MAIIQAEIKRGVLRSLFRTVAADAKLVDVLASFQSTGFASIRTGKLVVGSSGAGHSVTFQMPSVGLQWTQEQVFALSEELCDIYDDAVVILATATPANTNPTDAQIYAVMKDDDRMQTIRSVQLDQTALRYPATAQTR